jgi:phosphatidyl-myo-inositol alpha-mannosyltransferase
MAAMLDVRGLRVALVCPYAIDVAGGVQGQVTSLAHHLRASGATVDVYAPGGRTRPGFISLGRPQCFLDNGSVVRTVVTPWQLAPVARLGGAYDIVHAHEPMLPASAAAIMGTTAAVVGTFHMSAADHRWYRLFAPVLRPVRACIDVAVAVSPTARDFVAAALPGEYRLVSNAIDVEAAPARLPRPGHVVPRILFVGRDDDRKGLPVLLRAFGRLRTAARLDIAGAHVAAAPGVRSHGPVSQQRLRELRARADIVCAPSLGGESFGLVVLEGMAAGAAVVASDLPAYRRVLTPACGRLVPPGDDRALARSLDSLLGDRARLAAMGAVGRRRARRFDWSAVLPAILDAYADADRRRRGGVRAAA